MSLRRRCTTVDLAFLVERITKADKELAKVAALVEADSVSDGMIPVGQGEFAESVAGVLTAVGMDHVWLMGGQRRQLIAITKRR